ncbi:MAG: ABC transporter substrate-binding protein, partial [Lachnospiraceae bacterium]|nr:ABC transporter substrate-binding protein [Lachnospiraceae bacterium]
MKKLGLILIALSVSFMLFSCKNNDNVEKKENKEKKVYTIGITQNSGSDENIEIRKGIVQGLRECGYKEGVNVVYKNQHAKNNNSYITQINKKFVDDKCDMIVSIGTKCTLDALEVTKGTDTKVVYAAVTDPKGSGLSDKNHNPTADTTGTIDKYNVNNNLSLVKSIFPSTKKLGIMYTKDDPSSKRIIDEYKYYGSKNNIDIVTIAINTVNDIELAYDSLVKKVDAIMIINDDNIESNADYIIKKSIDWWKPVFAVDRDIVEKGALASYSVDLLEVGKETGKIASEVLSGKDIRSIKVKEVNECKLYANKSTMSKFGISM